MLIISIIGTEQKKSNITEIDLATFLHRSYDPVQLVKYAQQKQRNPMMVNSILDKFDSDIYDTERKAFILQLLLNKKLSA